MTPDQFSKLLEMLQKIAVQNYTITGAQDWPILLVLGGILIGAIGLMWADLKGAMKDNKVESKNEVDDLRAEFRRCQDTCWDLGGRRKGDHKE